MKYGYYGVVALLGASVCGAQYDLRAAGGKLNTARVAERAGDLQGYYQNAVAAAELVPRHPVLIYHHARAAARLGRNHEALMALDRLVPMGPPRNPATDSGFVGLWADAEFKARVADLERASAALVASDTAFAVALPNLVSENLAWDANGRRFLVGSIARRTILATDRHGRTTPFLEENTAWGQPLGMKVDAARKLLWVAMIWPVDSAVGRLRTQSALLGVDLRTGRVTRRFSPPDTGVAHLLNDMIVTPAGDILVTDSEAAAVWMLRGAAGELESFAKLPPQVSYPNGITLSPDGKFAMVAHQAGLLAINMATREVAFLDEPSGQTSPSLMGIDGLYTIRDGVLGIVNSSAIERVVFARREAAAASPTLTCSRTLERRHPAYEIPTTGALVGDTLFYVANSQLRRLDGRGQLRNPEQDVRTVILALRLSPAATDCER